MDKNNLASQILEYVGGEQNVSMVTHCATRLRFNLKDDSAAQTEKLKNLNGVMGVVNKGGQYQVVIGSDVGNVYRELLTLGNFGQTANGQNGKGNDEDGANKQDDRNPVIKVLDTIAGIFTPIIPAITGAGMLKAVMALLVAFKVVDNTSLTYQFLNFFADAAFYFLPFLIANSAAQKFRCNPYMAMSIAGVLVHPNFQALVTGAKAGEMKLNFIGIPVLPVSYSSSVIPIILGIWFMSFVEPLADKVSPKPVKFFTKPLLTLIVTAPVTLIVLGPLGFYIGEGIAAGIAFLNTYASWLVPFVVGTLSPLLVMTGMHYGLIPIGINNLATQGFDTVVGPGMLGSNIAQGGASLAVALRTKNAQVKQVAVSAGITAVCGITEPAMYGISLRFKRPLIAAMIGGGVSGFFLGITGVGRYTSGSPGLLALPGYIGTEGSRNIILACVGALIAFVVAFVISLILGIKDPEEKGAEASENKNATEKMTETIKLAADGDTKVKNCMIASPLTGEIVPLQEVNDPTFAEEVLGKGVAVIPNEGKVYAPFDGEAVNIFETKHALGLLSREGTEILIHVGLETVALNGKFFETHVKNGDRIKKGQLLLTFDLSELKSAGYDIVTPVIVTNAVDYSEIEVVANGKVNASDNLIFAKY